MKKYYLMVVTFIVTLTVNALANIIPFNNQLTAEISQKYPSYFTPANYVFSIWGVIYLSLAVMLIYLGLNQKKYAKFIEKVSFWFIIANIVNAAWMFSWHYELLVLSVLLMVVILFSLLQVYFVTRDEKKRSAFITFPASIYLGWISVATIANISSLLPTLGFNNVIFPDQVYSVLMIVIALVLGCLMLSIEKDYVYLGVIFWAVYGILVKFQDNKVIYTYGGLALAIAVVIAIFIIFKNTKLRDLDSN